jgi:hypothetical protein
LISPESRAIRVWAGTTDNELVFPLGDVLTDRHVQIDEVTVVCGDSGDRLDLSGSDQPGLFKYCVTQFVSVQKPTQKPKKLRMHFLTTERHSVFLERQRQSSSEFQLRHRTREKEHRGNQSEIKCGSNQISD